MSDLITPTKSESGWVVQMTPEMERAARVAEGSLVILYLSDGKVSAELLPPPSDEIKRSVRESVEKFKDAFAEMKRLGD
jgi:hypothetical protein